MTISRAEYSGNSDLYVDNDDPGTVLRRRTLKSDMSDPNLVESDRRFAELLAELDDDYGIRSPGMRLSQKDNPFSDSDPRIYVGADWVEGKSLLAASPEVPPHVVRQAIEAIISYYSDKTVNGGAYLSDLKPSNIMYGHTKQDEQEQLYFVDIEPMFWSFNPRPNQPLLLADEDTGFSELAFVIRQGISRGENWEDLRSDYINLVNMQKPMALAS